MKHAMIVAGLGLAMAFATPAAAQSVSANNPGGLAKAMRDAGYQADLDVDDYGDPMITTKFGTYSGAIYFYGCDSTRHDRCESFQFRAGLDRKKAMPYSLMNQIVQKYRYTAMWLDDEGDPWVNFDVFTGDGIPTDVFMLAYTSYSDTLNNVANMVFAEENGG